MKLVTTGLAISLVFAGTAAFAQVGGPGHGPKAAIGGAASGRVAGASVGGPATKGLSTGASAITKSTSTSVTIKKSGSTAGGATTGTTAITGQTGAGKTKH
jgi:hypothetical protein